MNFDLDRYLALQEAENALLENTYPIGAVIVDEDNNIISKGRNQVHPHQNATAHAEIIAIRNGGPSILHGKESRQKYTIYTSLEPCPMCTGGHLICQYEKGHLVIKRRHRIWRL